MRRSRLRPSRGARSGCPRVDHRGARVIDVNARHSERKIRVLTARARRTWRPLRTQLDSTDQPTRPLGDVLPVPKGQPLIPFGRAAMDAHERVQARRINELKSGQIDNQPDRADRSRAKLTVEHRSGRSVKHASQPDDRHGSPMLPSHYQLPRSDRLASGGDRSLDAREIPAVALATQ